MAEARASGPKRGPILPPLEVLEEGEVELVSVPGASDASEADRTQHPPSRRSRDGSADSCSQSAAQTCYLEVAGSGGTEPAHIFDTGSGAEFQDLLLAVTALGRPHRRTSTRPQASQPIRLGATRQVGAPVVGTVDGDQPEVCVGTRRCNSCRARQDSPRQPYRSRLGWASRFVWRFSIRMSVPAPPVEIKPIVCSRLATPQHRAGRMRPPWREVLTPRNRPRRERADPSRVPLIVDREWSGEMLVDAPDPIVGGLVSRAEARTGAGRRSDHDTPNCSS